MLTLRTLLLSTPGENKGVKTQSSTPFSNRFTIFHCAVTLILSCISLRPPATQLMRLPKCSQIRIASSPLPHGARFSRLSVRIPLTLWEGGTFETLHALLYPHVQWYQRLRPGYFPGRKRLRLPFVHYDGSVAQVPSAGPHFCDYYFSTVEPYPLLVANP